MRRRLTFVAAMALAVATAIAGYAIAYKSPTLQGADGNTQNIAVNLTPNKRPKSKPVPITLQVKTETSSTTNAQGVPSPATRAIIDFPKGLSIFTKGYPTCSASKLQNTSTEAAEEACKKAKIGSGEGTADLVVGTKVFPVKTTITAYNGTPQGGKPVVLLHNYSQTPVQTTLVLVGVVKKYNKQGFGSRLDVSIPLIAGGQGAITSFGAKISKTFRYKGKKRGYVEASCPSKSWKARGEFDFLDGESLTPVVKGKCKPKG
jgi:hypothetical protein